MREQLAVKLIDSLTLILDGAVKKCAAICIWSYVQILYV